MKGSTAILLVTFYTLAYAQSGIDADDPKLNFIKLFSSELKDEVACYRIPAIITAPNGDLVAAIDERVPSCKDLKDNPNINIVMRRSADSGRSWSAIETIIDYPLGKSASDPSMIVDEVSGEVLLFFNYMDVALEKDVYYLMLTISKDNGRTWSDPIDITHQITKPEWHHDFKFITSGRGIQTRDGKLVHTLVNLQRGLFLFESNNHGKTWNLIDTPIKPADESKVVELNDGSWMVNSRVNKEGNRYVHRSFDQGRSWESISERSLIDPGCNASLLVYPSSKGDSNPSILLFSNANHYEERKNLTIRISEDNGASWSDGKTIYAGSAAYSSMTILANGDIGLFFERDDYRENVFVHLTFPWIRAGQ